MSPARLPPVEHYRQRLVGKLLPRVLAELPAVLMIGPCATGTTTTARRYAKTVVRLDTDAEAAAFRAELDGRRIVAVEVKATAAPGPEHARQLRWLREQLGDRLTAGVVLHTGPRTFNLGERIIAAPISSLWA